MLLYLWWAAALLFYLLGTFLVLRARRPECILPEVAPGITVLKPLKGVDEGLKENLESFFLLEYPAFELIFSVAEPSDPAARMVAELQEKYPRVPSRLVLGLEGRVLNPKVNNLIRSSRLARHDLLMISDSNVRVSPRFLSRAVAQMGENVGVLTAVVAGVAARDCGGILESVYLNTFYARGMFLAFFFGRPCVIGKSMVFRRSAAGCFGGIEALGDYLAEDYMMGERMRGLGLEVRLMLEPVKQFVGVHSFSSFWKRHIRWGRIRKAHAPVAFFLEPLSMPLLAAAGSGLALHRVSGFGSAGAIALHLLAFLAMDFLVAARVNEEGQRHFLPGWLARELIAFPMWVAAAAGNTVEWRGRLLRLRAGGKISEEEAACDQIPAVPSPFSGGQQHPRIRLRATTSTAIGGSGRPKAILPEG